MRGIVGIGLGTVACALVLVAGAGSASAASKSCGKITPANLQGPLTIFAKGVSCDKAREVTGKFVRSKSTRPWSCLTGTPAVCKKGGKKIVIKPGFFGEGDRVIAARSATHCEGEFRDQSDSVISKVRVRNVSCQRAVTILLHGSPERAGFECNEPSGATRLTYTCTKGRKWMRFVRASDPTP